MKRNFINKYHLLIIIILLTGCLEKQKVAEQSGHVSQLDVNDPDIRNAAASPSESILSGIKVVSPEKKVIISPVQIKGKAVYDARKRKSISSRVSGRIEKMNIRYNFQEVRKGDVLMEIYTPELVTAQREYILALQQNENRIVQAAKQKLLLNGFPESLLNNIEKTKNPVYSIPVISPYNGWISQREDEMEESKGLTASPMVIRSGQYINKGENIFYVYDYSNKALEFSVPVNFAESLKPGISILYKKLQGNTGYKIAKADLILPVQKENGNFIILRSYISDEELKFGDLVEGQIVAVIPDSFWLPEKAVYHSGTRSVIFKKEEGGFRPVAVNTGISTNGMIQILTPADGWEVAENSSFLADSESFIKTEDYERN